MDLFERIKKNDEINIKLSSELNRSINTFNIDFFIINNTEIYRILRRNLRSELYDEINELFLEIITLVK